jgi:glycosyltransferase involved in cell wall biosynthesis
MKVFSISIVIPAFNEAGILPATLNSVWDAVKASGWTGPLEVVVCDNNSTDETAAVASRLGARVVHEPHNQIARARNTGARNATGDWLIFLDADTLLPSTLFKEVLSTMASGMAGAGGAPVHFDATRLRWGPRLVLAVWNAVSRWGRLAAGSFIFCQRADWETIGGFDEAFYAAEELDFSMRLKSHLARDGRRFVILKTPVLTSARKLEWHNDWQLLRLIPFACRPSLWKTRKACAFWYERPS